MSISWKILIVDDEPTITDTYAAVFERAGIEAEKAYDGKECIEKASLSRFDLILLDIRMPEFDGYEVMKKLKTLPHLKHTPLVFLTGITDTSSAIEAGYSLGATEYWRKPMGKDELTARVMALLRASDAERRLREMQENFTSMIVHDLRGPLSAIVGFAEIMIEEKEKVGPDITQMAVEINKSGKLMLNIINDFHEITRYETEGMRLAKRPVKLADIISHELEVHKAIVDRKSISVTVECGDIPSLMMDHDRMARVVDEVFDNALHCTPDRGTLAVRAQLEGQAVILDITDSGPGIPDKELAMLFDKMRIATSGSRHRGSRTGLGLPICRAIVEAHGGTISAAPAKGTGTTISITLPLHTA